MHCTSFSVFWLLNLHSLGYIALLVHNASLRSCVFVVFCLCAGHMMLRLCISPFGIWDFLVARDGGVLYAMWVGFEGLKGSSC